MVVPLALGVAGILTLRRELAGFQVSDLRAALDAVPADRMLLAVLATAGGYLALTLHDLLGLRYAGSDLPYRRVALPAFVGFAFANNVGAAVLSGGTVRFRLYAPLGVSAGAIAQVVAFVNLTIVLGEIVLGGISLAVEPNGPAALLRIDPALARPAGIALLATAALYLVGTRVFPEGIRIGRFRLPSPHLPVAVGQIVVSCADWSLAALAFFLLLPSHAPVDYPAFLAVFVLAQLLGGLSQVPGGLGVFDSVMIATLTPALPAAQVLLVILLYRFIYYLVPFLLAAGLLAGNELSDRRRALGRLALAARSIFGPAVPPMAALASFLAGTVLILLGALPVFPQRLQAVLDTVPPALLEVSHLLGSVVGVLLLLLARGLMQRLDGAWVLAVGLTGAGVLLSLGRGLQLEAAGFLLLVLLALLPFRGEFYRHSSLVKEPFTASWLGAVLLVVAGSVWLGWLAHRHDAYATEQFWRLAVETDVPRFVRASVAATATALLFGVSLLLRAAPHEPPLPAPDEIESVRPLLEASPRARDRRLLEGDLHLLRSGGNDAVLGYAPSGRDLVGVGDPVGNPEAATELCWRLRALADRHHGFACFLDVGARELARYVDLDLTTVPLGAVARVDLARAPELPPGMEIRVAPQGTGFLLQLHDAGGIAGQASLWRSAMELAVASTGPVREGAAPLLVAAILAWGRAQGLAAADLGLVPPPRGAVELPLAWDRLGATPYALGALVAVPADLHGLLAPVHPVWEPRYLAAPGGRLADAVDAAVRVVEEGHQRTRAGAAGLA